MKDPRTVLDGVRQKISPNAKLLVVWLEEDERGAMHCAQANLDQAELAAVIEGLRSNAIAARIARG
jgi:hypothetical protein